MPELATYDPARLMDAVRDRIRAEFVALIPEDAWKTMVQKAVNDFFKTKNNYGNEGPSEFQDFVHSLLREAVAKKVKEYMDSPEWQAQWDSTGKPMASAEIKKLLLENVGVVVASILGVAMQNAAQAMRSQIQ